MKKHLLRMLAMILLGTLLVSSASAATFDKATLRFGSTSAENTVVVATMKLFAEKVAAATSNQVTVQIFPASQLGNVKEMAQSAQMGALDMCMTQPANLADMGVKEMSVLVLPYIFKSFEQRYQVLTGDVGKELLNKVTDGGISLMGFGYFPDGARNFFTIKDKPIRTVEDVKGLKLRVQSYDLDNDMAIALGASPTPTASSEMYSAIQSGIVDGAEQPIAAYYGNKFYEVSSYLTLDEHTYNTLVVLFSQLSWNKLSPELQEVLSKSWTEAVDEMKNTILSTEEDYKQKIVEAGVEIIEITDREKWVDAMKPVFEKHGAGLETWIEKINAVE